MEDEKWPSLHFVLSHALGIFLSFFVKMVVPTKVFIGNLPEECEKEKLMKELECYGNVVEFDIVKNYAFAHFERMDDAKEAVEALDGKEFEGSPLKVELSRSRVRQKPGMGGKNCFRCGAGGHWSKDCPTNPHRGEEEEDGYGGDYDRGRYGRDSYDSDPYGDYYRGRYPPPPLDRYRPYPDLYARRRLPPPLPLPRDLYASRDPYARPPPDYYASRRSPPRDPLLELYLERAAAYRSLAPGPLPGRGSPPPVARPPMRPRPMPY